MEHEVIVSPIIKYRFERLNFPEVQWEEIESCPDHTIYQTRAWLTFISRTQEAEPVVAALKEGDQTVGYFTGLIIRKLGVRILGSPFPGWSTDYMGFALFPGASRKSALHGLLAFAFEQLGCAHVELMDRQVSTTDLLDLDVQCRLFHSFVIDLTQDETALFNNMYSDCRRCIRNAQKNGVVIEVAQAPDFAEDYFEQLKDVFAKQGLVPTYRLDRVKQLIAHLHPTGQLLLLRARDRSGRCIATGIFPYLNGVMSFWGGASWRQSQNLRPNQALQWYALRHAKANGVHTYDMGGGGEYKRQYGGRDIQVPWIRKSKYSWLASVRNAAQHAYKMRQNFLGQLRHLSNMTQRAARTDR